MRAFSHLRTNHRTKLVSRSEPTPPPACILFIHTPYKAHNTNLKLVQPTSARCFARARKEERRKKKCQKILIKQTRDVPKNLLARHHKALTHISLVLATKVSRVAKVVDTGVWPVQHTRFCRPRNRTTHNNSLLCLDPWSSLVRLRNKTSIVHHTP